jgi:hypothetical protein
MKTYSLKTSLMIVTIGFLACLAFGPRLPLATVAAQTSHVQYLVVESPNGRAAKQTVLDKYGQQGWRLVALDFAHEESFIFTR